ncbi:MAG TPA: acyl-CoA synthetase [Acidimicrobiia bacterium]|nr:acyl-CoA synthetase [Acidimicrobiia bacterium]
MDWSFASVFESVADSLSERTALVQGNRRHTWGELDDRAARLAGALNDLGLGPGSKVASYLYNSNEYLEGLYATFKLRGVPVNVNYRYLEDELAYLLDNSDAEVVLFHGSLAEHVDAVRARLPKVKAVVQVDDGSPHLDGALRYEDLIADTKPVERIERSGDDYLFLYTGGTTGMPKGVMWRQEDLFWSLAEGVYPLMGLSLPETAADCGPTAARNAEQGIPPVHLPASPLMHGTGQFTTFQSMFLGGTIVTLESRSFDPDELWRVVARERVTNMAIVGDAFAKPMLRALEEAEARGEPYDITSVALLISSGVIWSAPVTEEFMKRQPMICYDSLGSSEGVGFANAISAPGAETKTAKFTIGLHAKVLTEDGREVEPGSGEIGLLAVGGRIPVGYYKDPEKSAATFRELGGRRWSIPGDYASVEADGSVTLLGRGSVSINSGGEKIYPEEVEEAVKQHPAVADSVVVGVPDDRFGEAVTAVVSLRPGESASERDIMGAVEESGLARFKRPRHVVVVDDVPRAPNGKADYKWAKTTAVDRLA